MKKKTHSLSNEMTDHSRAADSTFSTDMLTVVRLGKLPGQAYRGRQGEAYVWWAPDQKVLEASGHRRLDSWQG